MPNRLSRRPIAPTLARHLVVALLALALLATACSDAHNQAQRDFVDMGVDPNVLTVLATPELMPVLKALDQAFLLVRPNTTLVFVNQIADPSGKHNRHVDNLTNTQIIQNGATPSLWIDDPSTLRPFATDSRAQGPVRPFTAEPMTVVVQAGNPAHVTGLDAFAPGGVPAGRCTISQPCGKQGTAWLAAAQVKAVYAAKLSTAAALITAITTGQVEVGLVQALDAAPGTPGISTVAVAAPPSPLTLFSMLCMSPNPTAVQFEQWLATSAEARAVLTTYGLLAGNGRTPT